MSFSSGPATRSAGWSVRRCFRSMIPPVLRLCVGPGRESCLASVLVMGEDVYWMTPELGDIHQCVVGILAVEECRRPVQMFEAERIIKHFLDDNAWYTKVIEGCQQGLHHSIALAGSDDHRLTLRTLFPRWVSAVTAVGKQVEPLHELWSKVVAEERYIILGLAYFKIFLPPGQGRLARRMHLIPALFNIDKNRIAKIIRVNGVTSTRINIPSVKQSAYILYHSC